MKMPVKWKTTIAEAALSRHTGGNTTNAVPARATAKSVQNSNRKESQWPGKPPTPRSAAPDPMAHTHHRSGRIELAAPAVIAPMRTRNNRAVLSAAGGSPAAVARRPKIAATAIRPTPTNPVVRTDSRATCGTASSGEVDGSELLASRSMTVSRGERWRSCRESRYPIGAGWRRA